MGQFVYVKKTIILRYFFCLQFYSNIVQPKSLLVRVLGSRRECCGLGTEDNSTLSAGNVCLRVEYRIIFLLPMILIVANITVMTLPVTYVKDIF